MSGIYGAFLNGDNRLDDNKKRLIRSWNSAYGTEKAERDGVAFLGCFSEKLNERLVSCSGVIDGKDKYAVIDAVIYNRAELLSKGAWDEKISDEELLFFYIEKYGMKSLAEINGDFCGAIVDEKNSKIILFRDHMGIRPIYYYCGKEGVFFSTDIRGILALSLSDVKINDEWVLSIFSGYAYQSADTTEYKNIFCVSPGTFIEFSFENGAVKKKSREYWAIGKKKVRLFSDKAYQNRLRELVEDAVRIRLESVTGMVGAELSGGLDSGVIDILIHRLGRDCYYYSWSMSPEKVPMLEKDERLIIEDICRQEGVTCNYGGQEIDQDSVITGKMRSIRGEIDCDELPAIRYVLPPNINALSICNTSEFVSKNGGTAVFTGHGGDEGVSHRCNPYEMFYYHELYHYLRYMFSTTNGKKHRIKNTIRRVKYNLGPVRQAFESPARSELNARRLLLGELARKFDDTMVPKQYFAYDPIRYVKGGGSRNRLENIALLGAFSGVRYMVPYLDYRVIDYAVSIPRYQYLRGRKDRYIFREAFKDIIPDSLYRQRLKEDTSWQNVESDTDWYSEFAKIKNEVINKLDRKLWEKYLDYKEIEAWAQKGEPSKDERDKEEIMLMLLFQCLMAQNALVESGRVSGC